MDVQKQIEKASRLVEYLIRLTVLMICTLAGLVPAWRAARLEPAEALRNK